MWNLTYTESVISNWEHCTYYDLKCRVQVMFLIKPYLEKDTCVAVQLTSLSKGLLDSSDQCTVFQLRMLICQGKRLVLRQHKIVVGICLTHRFPKYCFPSLQPSGPWETFSSTISTCSFKPARKKTFSACNPWKIFVKSAETFCRLDGPFEWHTLPVFSLLNRPGKPSDATPGRFQGVWLWVQRWMSLQPARGSLLALWSQQGHPFVFYSIFILQPLSMYFFFIFPALNTMSNTHVPKMLETPGLTYWGIWCACFIEIGE